jgi:hypothetical protein
LGKLLALPTNVRRAFKNRAGINNLAEEGKYFITLATFFYNIATFFTLAQGIKVKNVARVFVSRKFFQVRLTFVTQTRANPKKPPFFR